MQRTRLALVLTIALMNAAGAAFAAPPEPSYALERVAVVAGGLPVRGVEDGVVFEQAFDDQCRLSTPPSAIAEPPLAGRVGLHLALEITIAGCQARLPPHVDCSWTITGRQPADASCPASGIAPASGDFSWVGWQRKRPVPLPAATGIYDLDLRCRIEAPGATPVEEKLRRTLYVTYSDPLIAFSPPEVGWYELAACWAAGLGRDAAEDDVVKAILDGLYAYGRRWWRYGFSDQLDNGSFRFPLLDRESGVTAIHAIGENVPMECFGGEPPFCKCSWQALVDPGDDCNFADCYVFSHVLQAMSGVMGVGGLIPVKVKGKEGAGFVTRPTASLDPSFIGNVVCRDVGKPCYPYYFSSHSLRLRDGVFYDATFDRTYERAEDLIALSREKTEQGVLSFVDSDFKLYLIKELYGTWPYYFDRDPRNQNKRTQPVVAFTGNVEFSKVPSAAAEISRLLEAKIEVEILEEGDYVIQGQLLKDDVVISAQSLNETPVPASNHLSGEPGKYWVSLYFSGDDVFQSGVDGPYELHAFIAARGFEPVELKVATPLYEHRQFGENAIEEGSISVVPLAEPTSASAERTPASDDQATTQPLNMKIDFDVRQEGLFWVEGRLSKDGRSLAYTGARVRREATSAEGSVELQFIPRAGPVPPPYDLTVVIYDSQRKAVDSLVMRLDPTAPR